MTEQPDDPLKSESGPSGAQDPERGSELATATQFQAPEETPPKGVHELESIFLRRRVRAWVSSLLLLTPMVLAATFLYRGWDLRGTVRPVAQEAARTAAKAEIEASLPSDLPERLESLQELQREVESCLNARPWNGPPEPRSTGAETPGAEPVSVVVPPDPADSGEQARRNARRLDELERIAAELGESAALAIERASDLERKLGESKEQIAALQSALEELKSDVTGRFQSLDGWRRTMGETWNRVLTAQAQATDSPLPLPGTDLLVTIGQTPFGRENELLDFRVAAPDQRVVFGGRGQRSIKTNRPYSFNHGNCAYTLVARVIEPSRETYNLAVVEFTRHCG